MPEYQWALGNGEIISADYNRANDALSNADVLPTLTDAFQQFGHIVNCRVVSAELLEVYLVSFENDTNPEVIICGKGTTPGGRANLNDEQRTQQKSKYINYAYQKQQAGFPAVQLGIYKRDGQTIFCAWKLKSSNSDSETPISKQIKITTIAQAMKEGFVQQEKGHGEYACAFRKEFLYFYIRNAHWLHGALVTELAEHTPPLSDEQQADTDSIIFSTGLTSDFPRNRILFGAPGTGKSFTLNREKDDLLDGARDCERVTFHPDYTYANFVGTYKPIPSTDNAGNDVITYAYVPGPFMRTYVNALKNSRELNPRPFLLLIEEINRANVAAVFGDVFQLLDRNDDEFSEYPIRATEDMKKYLHTELGGNIDDYTELRIPDNMFIWATMNSADQGVFPMDTAFKRRWDFTYLGIDASESGIVDKTVVLGQGEYQRIVEWNTLRKAINNTLLDYKVNEDKLMGPYFIAKKNLGDDTTIDPVSFAHVFKNKVLMYLFEDAARQRRDRLFAGCESSSQNLYSKICHEFDTKGVFVFLDDISSQFIDRVPEGT